jgi:hypothetical protein
MALFLYHSGKQDGRRDDMAQIDLIDTLASIRHGTLAAANG